VAGVEGGRIVGDGEVNEAKVNEAKVNEASALEIFKQLTTLNAGSIVLIGTFLGDIFPKKHGNLAVGPVTTQFIALSFLCFGVSLVASTYSMYQFAHFETWLSRKLNQNDTSKWAFGVFLWVVRVIAGMGFSLGAVFFGWAVLRSLL
jgi:hypothetical protein